MGCFTGYWFAQLLVWIVILCGVVAILNLLVPWVLGLLGWTPAAPLFQILRIIIAVIVIVALIWFVFDLLSCLGGPGGMRLRP
jgi:hypothetical protein